MTKTVGISSIFKQADKYSINSSIKSDERHPKTKRKKNQFFQYLLSTIYLSVFARLASRDFGKSWISVRINIGLFIKTQTAMMSI